MNGNVRNPAGCYWVVLLVFLISVPAWLTHVVVCFKDGSWGFLIAGAIAAPVAVVHGIGIWFGLW